MTWARLVGDSWWASGREEERNSSGDGGARSFRRRHSRRLTSISRCAATDVAKRLNSTSDFSTSGRRERETKRLEDPRGELRESLRGPWLPGVGRRSRSRSRSWKERSSGWSLKVEVRMCRRRESEEPEVTRVMSSGGRARGGPPGGDAGRAERDPRPEVLSPPAPSTGVGFGDSVMSRLSQDKM